MNRRNFRNILIFESIRIVRFYLRQRCPRFHLSKGQWNARENDNNSVDNEQQYANHRTGGRKTIFKVGTCFRCWNACELIFIFDFSQNTLFVYFTLPMQHYLRLFQISQRFQKSENGQTWANTSRLWSRILRSSGKWSAVKSLTLRIVTSWQMASRKIDYVNISKG